MAPSTKEDHVLAELPEEKRKKLFPPKSIVCTPRDGDPLDLREENTWRYMLGDIDPKEIVEGMQINALAPVCLLQCLLPKLKSTQGCKAVVNVAACEGCFGEIGTAKNGKHVHGNMAFAA